MHAHQYPLFYSGAKTGLLTIALCRKSKSVCVCMYACVCAQVCRKQIMIGQAKSARTMI